MRSRLVSLLIPLFLVSLVAAACGSDEPETSAETTSTTTTTTTTPTTSTTTTTTTPDAPPDTTTTTEAPAIDCSVIGDDGIPVIAADASDAEILAALGSDWTSLFDDAFLVDIEGYQYMCGGETIFYGGWGAGSPEVVGVVISDHPSFVDPAGVGPGMLITDAVAAHGGSGTVGISTDFELREFISFADGGELGWSYRVGSEGGFAGVYPEPLDGYVETSEFVAGATVVSIWWEPGGGTAVAGDVDHPLTGTITELQMGDIACYANVLDGDGTERFVTAGFEICLQDELIDNEAQFIYDIANLSACESAEPCGESTQELIIVEAVLL